MNAAIARAWWWMPLVIALPILALLIGMDLDRRISDYFYDATTQTFPLRHDWLMETVLHDAVKPPVVLFAAALLGAVLIPWQRVRRYRAMNLFLLSAMTASAGLVSLIKGVSSTACPSRLSTYGGTHPLVAPWAALAAPLEGGHCWPGGHVSTAFALFGLYFVLRHLRMRRGARIALAAVIVFGLTLTIAQVARGAHFASHQVWTALLCWYVALALWSVWPGVDRP